MQYQDFYQEVVTTFPEGTILHNPGSGTTEIVSYASDDKMVYKRGHSHIYVSIVDLYDAYQHFLNKTVSSSNLRAYAPEVFDSKEGGHSCNCTLLFMLLKGIGATDRIEGEGIRGDPFQVSISLG